MSMISDKTLIPLGLALLVIGGGSVWSTRLESEVKSNSKWIESRAPVFEKIADRQDEIFSEITKIRSEISEMRGELRRIRQ